MDIARLRTLRELSLRQTMAAVAEALRISPSAVSQQIALLESEAGLRLIERRGRRVRLTQAGQRLVAHAERVIAVLEDAKTELAELKQAVTGELRVAAFSSVAAALIPQAMKALERRHPQLTIVLEEMEPVDSLAALRAWQADVALVDDLTVPASVAEPNIERIPILDDLLYAVLPNAHPLAARAKVAIADLRDERWAMDTAFNTYSDVIIRACQAAGFDPVVNGKCGGFEVVQPLIEQGCSVAILPGLRVGRRSGKFCVRKADAGDPPQDLRGVPPRRAAASGGRGVSRSTPEEREGLPRRPSGAVVRRLPRARRRNCRCRPRSAARR
jgi:DNA-binding transcriptional LysR family regulator